MKQGARGPASTFSPRPPAQPAPTYAQRRLILSYCTFCLGLRLAYRLDASLLGAAWARSRLIVGDHVPRDEGDGDLLVLIHRGGHLERPQAPPEREVPLPDGAGDVFLVVARILAEGAPLLDVEDEAAAERVGGEDEPRRGTPRRHELIDEELRDAAEEVRHPGVEDGRHLRCGGLLRLCGDDSLGLAGLAGVLCRKPGLDPPLAIQVADSAPGHLAAARNDGVYDLPRECLGCLRTAQLHRLQPAAVDSHDDLAAGGGDRADGGQPGNPLASEEDEAVRDPGLLLWWCHGRGEGRGDRGVRGLG
mmetsp:Transcript_104573/g.234776  ORF Transcript_104573/g.234776 Transcript_104573/m.234776 type:complete len:305 (+) Transcript_104573:65-979(+)